MSHLKVAVAHRVIVSVGVSAFGHVTFLTNVNISDGVNVCKVRKGDNRKQTG